MAQRHVARSNPERFNLYQQITDRIIADLEAGRVPWVQPWGTANAGIGMPHNAVSSRRYSGINVLIRAFVLGIIESQQASSAEAAIIGPGKASFRHGHREELTAGRYWPNSDPINDPESGPLNDPITGGLNERQRWILDRVARGLPTRARDVAAHWRVSIKSARRDLAGLCASNLLHFVGARKNGRYHLVRS